ncbi:Rv1355c family protein [Pedobacter sp. FW305-3-2-15-E-R2A2]|uniref:Rv1355c family protein n=1 Tax=Pedobacter sp. FW305-3-2-15-E-R2A2 TaxID=3140251 RepID=UPI00313FF11E
MLVLENLIKEDFTTCEPKFFRIYQQQDKDALEALLKDKPHTKIHDEIETQLDDLIKSQHPKKKPEPAEMEALKIKHIGNLSKLEYGVWVYYPWSERLVHLLDEEEFIAVRTNRNIYKITPEERDILGKQKIGVVGLSVGQSISITMAMERGFGEIRLADFDLLELTNLNRIRTGVQNLGIKKVVLVAREIKEIDPFLKVTCFDDGMTEENMDRFFTEGGNLDIVVDECDGLDIKILLRHKAKSLGIPVVQDMSDRGTLDVERFDLEPERPILHGWIDHLDHTQVKYLKTNEEKVPFLLAMIGVDTLSNRLKASMVEVGQSITTWPQLASAVALGGALGADVCRRISLKQYTESGRYFVDLEDLIGDKNKAKDNDYNVVDYTAEVLTENEMNQAIAAISSKEIESFPLSTEQVEQLVSAAAIAPSAGNNQPWKWVARSGKLYLFHDEQHSVSWGDFDNITSNIAFGTAIENIKLEAGKAGLTTSYLPFPNPENKRLVAAFSFQKTDVAYATDLAAGMGIRLTNRKQGNKAPIEAAVITSLKSAASLNSPATLQVIQDEQQIDLIADIVAGVERVRFLYPQGHHDFYTKEIRWTPEAVNETKDGLDILSLELSESDKTGLKVAESPEVIKLLNRWGGGAAFENLSRKAIRTSSGIGLVTMPSYEAENFLKGGEAVQRVWINANLNGLSFHPISAPLFLFARLNHGNGAGLNQKMTEELSKYQKDLLQIFPTLGDQQGVFMFRLSHASAPTVRALRKPLKDILQFI